MRRTDNYEQKVQFLRVIRIGTRDNFNGGEKGVQENN